MSQHRVLTRPKEFEPLSEGDVRAEESVARWLETCLEKHGYALCPGPESRRIVETYIARLRAPLPLLDCDKLRDAAREQYAEGSDDDIEVDADASLSCGDMGAYVQGWLWVRYEDAKVEQPEGMLP